MGQLLSWGSSEAPPPPMTLDRARALFAGGFFHGYVKDIFLVSIEAGAAFAPHYEVLEEGRVVKIDGVVRLVSWVRKSLLYPITVTLYLQGDAVRAVGYVAATQPGGGWDTVNVHQDYTGFLHPTRIWDGYWSRNELRRTAHSSETLNTSGSFNLQYVAAIFPPEGDWNTSSHAAYRDAQFRRAVLALLMLHRRRETLFALLPKDVLFLVIARFAPRECAVEHPRFAEVMLDEGMSAQQFRQMLAHYGQPEQTPEEENAQ